MGRTAVQSQVMMIVDRKLLTIINSGLLRGCPFIFYAAQPSTSQMLPDSVVEFLRIHQTE